MANSKQALVVDAAAEAANQVSYGKRHCGSRVRALLYGRTQEVVGLAGGFADGVGRSRRRVLCLSVDILQSTFRLLCLALELGFHVAGCASESLFRARSTHRTCRPLANNAATRAGNPPTWPPKVRGGTDANKNCLNRPDG